MNAPPWLRNHPFRMMFVLFGVIMLVAGVYVDHQFGLDTKQNAKLQQEADTSVGLAKTAKAQAARLREETIERQTSQCVSGNVTRKTIPSIIDQIASPPSNVRLDLTKIAGFKALTPEFQFYLVGLNGQLAISGTNARLRAIAADYRRTNPVQDCDKLRADLVKRLDKPKERPHG